MSGRRGSDMEIGGAHGADYQAKVDPSKDLDDETKAAWMKRRAKEERKHRQGIKVVDEWFEVIRGTKLVKKLKKNNGGVYSIYLGNTKNPKTKEFLSTLVRGVDGEYRMKGATK